MELMEVRRDGFLVSTDSAKLDVNVIHGFLKDMLWSVGIPRKVVEKAIANSLCFGVYDLSKDSAQVGFCRVVTDYTKLAFLDDVFILEPYRGQGLSKFMLECVMAHPALQDVAKWLLATMDAHGLYAKFGFTPIPDPGGLMQIRRMDIYREAR